MAKNDSWLSIIALIIGLPMMVRALIKAVRVGQENKRLEEEIKKQKWSQQGEDNA